MTEAERPVTRTQEYAQRAFERIQMRTNILTEEKKRKEFAAFTKRFPTLIHTCGLCQALAFAQAKDRDDYLDDLVAVMKRPSRETLLGQARSEPVPAYMNLSRDAIKAAGWLKRYAEASMDDEADKREGGE